MVKKNRTLGITISEDELHRHDSMNKLVFDFFQQHHEYQTRLQTYLEDNQEKYIKYLNNSLPFNEYMNSITLKSIEIKRKKIPKDPNRTKKDTYFTISYAYHEDKLRPLFEAIGRELDRKKYCVPEYSNAILTYLKTNNRNENLKKYTVNENLVKLFPGLEEKYDIGYNVPVSEVFKLIHYIIKTFILNKDSQ